MPAIVAIPQVVEEILLQFGDLFPNQPARVHLAEYITGLYVADRKTVSGISREFAATTDHFSHTIARQFRPIFHPYSMISSLVF